MKNFTRYRGLGRFLKKARGKKFLKQSTPPPAMKTATIFDF